MEECRQRKVSDYPPVVQSANLGNKKWMDLGIIEHLHSTALLFGWDGIEEWRHGGMGWD